MSSLTVTTDWNRLDLSRLQPLGLAFWKRLDFSWLGTILIVKNSNLFQKVKPKGWSLLKIQPSSICNESKTECIRIQSKTQVQNLSFPELYTNYLSLCIFIYWATHTINTAVNVNVCPQQSMSFQYTERCCTHQCISSFDWSIKLHVLPVNLWGHKRGCTFCIGKLHSSLFPVTCFEKEQWDFGLYNVMTMLTVNTHLSECGALLNIKWWGPKDNIRCLKG